MGRLTKTRHQRICTWKNKRQHSNQYKKNALFYTYNTKTHYETKQSFKSNNNQFSAGFITVNIIKKSFIIIYWQTKIL